MNSVRPVRDVIRSVASEPVPSYARGARVLGLIAAILFGLEAVTGVLLACWYRPTPEAAFGPMWVTSSPVSRSQRRTG